MFFAKRDLELLLKLDSNNLLKNLQTKLSSSQDSSSKGGEASKESEEIFSLARPYERNGVLRIKIYAENAYLIPIRDVLSSCSRHFK